MVALAVPSLVLLLAPPAAPLLPSWTPWPLEEAAGLRDARTSTDPTMEAAESEPSARAERSHGEALREGGVRAGEPTPKEPNGEQAEQAVVAVQGVAAEERHCSIEAAAGGGRRGKSVASNPRNLRCKAPLPGGAVGGGAGVPEPALGASSSSFRGRLRLRVPALAAGGDVLRTSFRS